jgi:predicted RNA-binding Zn ribbon-like protein
MNFDSYADLGVAAAAELINHLTEGWAQGALRRLPQSGPQRTRLAAATEAAIWGRGSALGGPEAEELILLAERLREVFAGLAAGDADGTAHRVNSLLREYHAAPQLATHDGEPWHLHFHSQDREVGRVEARGATCAVALATVIGSGWSSRLGTCAAERCALVFVDTSRNGSRRFCSLRCLNRDKVARFRSRHPEGALVEGPLPGSPLSH